MESLKQARKEVEEYEERHGYEKGSILKSVRESETDAGRLTPWTLELPDRQTPGGSGAASPGLGSLQSC